jgi:hypothetical protein
MGSSLRSSIGSTIDLGRLASAVSRPGIDPRVWVSYGVLTSEPVIDTDATDNSAGVFVEVLLMPSGMTETARVGAMYAGNGFGFYAPLHKDDEVLVCAPSGDPDEGLVVTQRLWSPADPPPAAIATYPTDVTLVVEKDKALRLNVSGGGKVYIGANDGTKPVAYVDSEIEVTITVADIATMALTSPSGPVTATSPVTLTGKVTTGSAVAEVAP